MWTTNVQEHRADVHRECQHGSMCTGAFPPPSRFMQEGEMPAWIIPLEGSDVMLMVNPAVMAPCLGKHEKAFMTIHITYVHHERF